MERFGLLDTVIGIVGGGQLGKMLTQKAKELGLSVIILDPTPNSPAGQVADSQIVCGFNDYAGYEQLARESDVITYEFEHVSADYLFHLEKQGALVRPSANSLAVIQDKGIQKQYLQKYNLPVPDFQLVNDFNVFCDILDECDLPMMLKARTGGYDGKGNYLVQDRVHGQAQKQEIFNSLAGKEYGVIIEEYLNFDKEVSVMVARNSHGHVINYPVVENIHQDSILLQTTVPTKLEPQIKTQVEDISKKVMDAFSDIGVFGIELFVLPDNQVVINEIAPRVHNSGHYTIEACDVSQFETHIRAMIDLPLINPTLLGSACMINLLGEGKQGKANVTGTAEALAFPGLSLHLYGKKESRPGRKMGHYTVVNHELSEAITLAHRADDFLTIYGE